jgi:methionyl-tRNA formyltransferase
MLLTCEGESGRIATRFLAARFPDLRVIVEQPVSRAQLLRRRIRRLGVWHVAGQLAFMLFQRMQEARSRGRIAEIKREFAPDAAAPDDPPALRVASVNSAECVAAIVAADPKAVIVVGTRLIDGDVLRGLSMPLINYHAGVTPKYRGVHGGYWALAEDDAENCGVTVHLVDEGIDTGGVLHQSRISPSPADDFSTYPYLQLAAALPLLERAAREAIAGTLTVRKPGLSSRLWSHPTIWSYLTVGLRKGVW